MIYKTILSKACVFYLSYLLGLDSKLCTVRASSRLMSHVSQLFSIILEAVYCRVRNNIHTRYDIFIDSSDLRQSSALRLIGVSEKSWEQKMRAETR